LIIEAYIQTHVEINSHLSWPWSIHDHMHALTLERGLSIETPCTVAHAYGEAELGQSMNSTFNRIPCSGTKLIDTACTPHSRSIRQYFIARPDDEAKNNNYQMS